MANRNIRKSVRKDERAVSPVIGVILMVAITVILAAVIGAFVFGMGGSLQKTYTVGVTATQVDSDHVDVTFQGGPDAGQVDYMVVGIDGQNFDIDGNETDTANEITFNSDGAETTILTADGLAVPVGSMITCTNEATGGPISSGRDHVIVTAAFMDGTTQVVLDTYV